MSNTYSNNKGGSCSTGTSCSTGAMNAKSGTTTTTAKPGTTAPAAKPGAAPAKPGTTKR